MRSDCDTVNRDRKYIHLLHSRAAIPPAENDILLLEIRLLGVESDFRIHLNH